MCYTAVYNSFVYMIKANDKPLLGPVKTTQMKPFGAIPAVSKFHFIRGAPAWDITSMQSA